MVKIGEDTQTPMLKQYFSIKAQYPDTVLLYRVGDFYETYSSDAEIANKVLGIVLTKRSQGGLDMAGFPYHAIETYLQKLINAGYKVAICDQLEEATGSKKIVKRGITEILTPGIAFGESMLQQKEHNYLAGLSFNPAENRYGIAFLDVSTGTFQLSEGSLDYISTLIASFNPKELVVCRDQQREIKAQFPDYYISNVDEWAFVGEAAVERLCKQLGVKSLKGFAVDKYPKAIEAAGALLVYLEQTQHSGLKNICSLSRIDEDKFMWMDKFTLRNLEIFNSTDGISLVQTIDRCSTPMGSRLLRTWLAMPLLDTKAISARQDVVEALVQNEELLDELKELLGGIGDLERVIARAATGKISPREMLGLARSLSRFSPIKELCQSSNNESLQKLSTPISNTDATFLRIHEVLLDSCSPQIGKGDVIASGINEELDELREISHGSKEYLAAMQQRESERTGIPNLKISYNNVFGYFLEVRNTFKDKVPQEWIRRQTLVNAERYITPELKEYESKILGAEARIYEIETRIYAALVTEVQKDIKRIQENCAIVSQLDVLQGFATQALERNYCRPLVDKSSVLEIKEGRHPVIETLMQRGEEYVPNDLKMDSKGEQIIILTGPNMAGKSALLRQSALIVLMAQVGSFVPAKEAHFGYFDKLFTRVGASDNISRGESTFMVEMLETSMIMHNLSARSLVLLDEIGRGTSTYDGMSIARALVEYIHAYGHGAKTLFATHYHELNDLENKYPRVKNYHIAVKEDGKNIIFLRKLVEGGVAHSFGIHVARLAGMPVEVVELAEKTLRDLERREKHASNITMEADGSMQLSFFQLDDPTLSSLKDKLEGADLNNMTPLQAFDLLRAMKNELGLN